jgi:hypothetical protein
LDYPGRIAIFHGAPSHGYKPNLLVLSEI